MRVGAVSASLAGLGGGEDGGRSLQDLIDDYRLMIFDGLAPVCVGGFCAAYEAGD